MHVQIKSICPSLRKVQRGQTRFFVDMAEGVVVDDGKLSSEKSQAPASVVKAVDSAPSRPILLVVAGEPLSETHKDAVAKRIATGEARALVYL